MLGRHDWLWSPPLRPTTDCGFELLTSYVYNGTIANEGRSGLAAPDEWRSVVRLFLADGTGVLKFTHNWLGRFYKSWKPDEGAAVGNLWRAKGVRRL